MNDGWSTTNLFLASAVAYTYGYESLTGIELRPVPNSRNEPEYMFDIASGDGEILTSDYDAGTLAVTDVKALATSYSRLTGQLKAMHRRNEIRWRSSAWIAGVDSKGRKIK